MAGTISLPEKTEFYAGSSSVSLRSPVILEATCSWTALLLRMFPWYSRSTAVSFKVRVLCFCCRSTCYGMPVRVLVFLKFVFTDALKYGKAPSSHRGAEEDGDVCASSLLFSGAVHQMLSLWYWKQRQSIELPATTFGE